MNKQTGVIGDKDACNLAFAQSSSYLVKFKVFANNTIGQSNQSDVLSITVDNVLPNITDTTISADCFAVGDGATISWNQQDDIYIMNSTCYWTSPVTSTAYTTTMLPGDGPRSCYQVLNEYGVWQWHLYLNDSAGNTHDYYSGVNARAAGTCGGSSPPGGGGGGGGGGGWQPTPINVSEIPVITAKQIEALPATRWFQGLIAPRLGPFSVFHALVFAGALFYFRKPKNREGRNVIFALAIIAFAFLIVWQSVNMSISDVMMSIQSLIGNVNIPNIPIIQQGGTP
jgi:hypothetical protein